MGRKQHISPYFFLRRHSLSRGRFERRQLPLEIDSGDHLEIPEDKNDRDGDGQISNPWGYKESPPSVSRDTGI
jgi:hypothetical protein